jgi:uncharacterized protein (DUF2336 family)
MTDAELAIVGEIETAITTGSADNRLETIKRVTELFLASAGGFNAEQIELFDDVLERLIKTIEIRAVADISARMALAEVSTQLAPIAQAPPSVIRRLARHDEIAVAGPVLIESARLNADDLVEIAQTKGEPHLLAISGRWWLKEVVTDALLARNYPAVSRRVVSNPGARLSASGFADLVMQAESDPELAVKTGIRIDLPTGLRQRLLRRASDTVRTKLLSRAPPHLCDEIRNAIAEVTTGVNQEMSRVRDFTAAKRQVAQLHERGELNEAALCGFAKQRRYEETVVALAQLSKSTIEVVRSLMQSPRDDGLFIACKVAGLSWETVSAVLECRFSSGSIAPEQLAKAKDNFAKITSENARRLLELWQIRAPAPPPRMH